MKKIKYLMMFTIVLLMTSLFSSCDEPDDDNNTNDSEGGNTSIVTPGGSEFNPDNNQSEKTQVLCGSTFWENIKAGATEGSGSSVGHPTPPVSKFHSGRALARENVVFLDSRSDKTVEQARVQAEEFAGEFFLINDEKDAHAYFSDEFLERHPEFLNSNSGGSQLVVCRYYTTRNNAHLQLNFIEDIEDFVSIDLSYFHFISAGEAENDELYTQLIGVWTRSSAFTSSTLILPHIHIERR